MTRCLSSSTLLIILIYGSKLTIWSEALNAWQQQLEAEVIRCPDNYTYNPWDRNCLKVHPHDTDTWDSWHTRCGQAFRHPSDHADVGLVKIKDARTLQTITKLMPPTYVSWIHAVLYPKEGRPNWTSPYYTGPMERQRTRRGRNECVTIQKEPGQAPRYFHKKCEQTSNAICQISPLNSCSDNNGGCQHLCYPTGLYTNMCACRLGYTLAPDRSTCIQERGPEKRNCHVENGGCEDNCSNGACTCPKGFKVVNKTKCRDIDECEHHNGGCEQMCHNTRGSWYCSCKVRFDYDGLFCRVKVPVDEATNTNTDKMSAGPKADHKTTPPAAIPVIGAATVMASVCAVLVVTEYTKLTRKKAMLSLASARLAAANARGDDDGWDREVNFDENELRDLSILTGSFDDSYIEPASRNNTFV